MNKKYISYIISGVVGVLFTIFMPVDGGASEDTLPLTDVTMLNFNKPSINNDILTSKASLDFERIMLKQVHLTISGKVQGVFFRNHAQKKAVELGIKGFVKNTSSGTVEILAQGEPAALNQFIDWCKKGPEYARIDGVTIERQDVLGNFNGFFILP